MMYSNQLFPIWRLTVASDIETNVIILSGQQITNMQIRL